MRRSAPASSRCVAYRMSQCVRRDRLVDLGALGRESHGFPDRLGRDGFIGAPSVAVPGKRYVVGRIQRQYSRSATSSVGLSGTSRSRPPLPWST